RRGEQLRQRLEERQIENPCVTRRRRTEIHASVRAHARRQRDDNVPARVEDLKAPTRASEVDQDSAGRPRVRDRSITALLEPDVERLDVKADDGHSVEERL